MKSLLLIINISFMLISCEKLVMNSVPKTDNLAIFDSYVKLVKEKYAMLDFKGVDINQLSDSLRATITQDLSDTALFIKCAYITFKLRDGHSNLESETLFQGFNIKQGFPKALDIPKIQNNYLHTGMIYLDNEDVEATNSENYKLVYGFLQQDPNLAYMRIPSFDVSISDSELNNMFGTINPATGLIIDVRGNGGGNPALATKMASYFITEKTYTGFERFKTGPGVNDFVDSPSYLVPAASDDKFLKPVFVLTDRGVYSATTTFCYNLDPLANVKFLGQKTGGGSGSVASGALANGWSWSLSVSEFIDYQNKNLDDGVEPDIILAYDTLNNVSDNYIETAILALQ